MDFSAANLTRIQCSSLSFSSSWNFRRRISGTKSFLSKDINCIKERRKRLGRHRLNVECASVATVDLQDSQEVQACCLTPLVSALKAAGKENAASFHFPGHNRGHGAPPLLSQVIGERAFRHDLPELPELDNLFAPNGPILEAQKMAAVLFGALETWFLVGGTTCGIQAAILATCSPGDTVILPRNSHISAISAMVLSGALPKYIMPDYDSNWDISGGITPSQVERALKELETEGRKAAAVFIVSPTYHGICSNIAAISELCHSHCIPLIIDEAHGAHFGFHELLPCSALHQGADIAVQSTHKVLSSLTQSSMLHMSGNLVNIHRISQCLQTLQTSSPSYLLLASLDAARAQLSENRETVFSRAIEFAMHTKMVINTLPGISILDHTTFSSFPDIDPLRITISTRQLGLCGFEADDILSKDYGVVPELVGTQSITLAFNLGTQWDHVERLTSGLKHISSIFTSTESEIDNKNNSIQLAAFDNISMSLSPRDAFFSRKEKVGIGESIGRISGELVCPYPPGIPILIPGEIVTEAALDYLLQVKDKGAIISGASDRLLSSLVVCNP